MTVGFSSKSRETTAARVLSAAGIVLALSGCATSGATDIALEMSAPPTLDVSPFQRVLVPGFVVGGRAGIDANEETVRLLRSRLRSGSSLKVIDSAGVLPPHPPVRIHLHRRAFGRLAAQGDVS